MSQSIVDVDALVDDLRMATAYASRVGLLQEAGLLDSLKAAEDTLRAEGKPDMHVLTVALNNVVRVIAPLTMADLRFGRDPLSPANQKQGRLLQLCLTALALGVLLLIGYFMQSLHEEQEAIQTLNQIQELRPQQKLTAVRKIAQFDQPLERPNTSYETYHQKVIELMQINTKLMLSYNNAVAAAMIPLFPSPAAFARSFSSAPSMAALAPAEPPPPSDGATGAAGVKPASIEAEANTANSPNGERTLDPSQLICVEETNGTIRLPLDALKYPSWMRSVLSDSLSDFCFQLKVLSPTGQGTLLNESLNQLTFLPVIKEKVSLRLNWFLPFFSGVLGSIILVMRNVASVRTPAVEWFPILMRLSLGGVAGVVIGWFGALAVPGLESKTALSVPFALAFLTGYSIELLFNLLDRMIRTVGDPAATRRA
ncbi:MAG TPA: hypothetical protein VGA59_02135 [Ramlibacter sp.]|jgi:hypothetical protein